MSPDTPSVRVQLIRDAAKAFNRVLDEQEAMNPPAKVNAEIQKGRLVIEAVDSNPQPENWYTRKEEDAEADDG